MTTLPAMPPDETSTAAPTPRIRPGALGLRLAAVGLGAAALALGWSGGALGASGVLAAGLAVPWLLREADARASAGANDPSTESSSQPPMQAGPRARATAEPRVNAGRVGAEVMVGQVVPVWSQQIDVTRTAAANQLGKLLECFSEMSGALGSLSENLENFTPMVDAGAVDKALGKQSSALTALLAPSQRAFEQRDAAVSELTQCAEAINELRLLGKQALEIGKHTRLVAFNASIEANRTGNNTDGGGQAVANETRMLAARMREVGEQIDRLVSQLDRTLSARRLSREIDDTTPNELQMELSLRAREALNGLLGSMGASMHGSSDLRATSARLRDQLDEAFVHFQFGDRLSQMLTIVGTDMHNFARWVAVNPYATQTDAAEWLANLESSYTMDEQRAQHHGNVHIDRGSEIEFF